MADTVDITEGVGTTIATDDCGASGHTQIVKLAYSGDGVATPILADADGPTSGRILSKGKEINRLMPHDICVMGGTNTHQVVKPFPEMTVLDNVRVGAFFGKGWATGEVKDATQEAMSP